MSQTEPVLVLRNVVSGYQKKQVLRGLNLKIYQNQVTAVIGHNGAGKTTLLRTVFRLVPPHRGEIWYMGENVTAAPTSQNRRLGVSFVPQGRGVFPSLTVQENLDLAFLCSRQHEAKEAVIKDIFDLFPALIDRRSSRAFTLSGGLKQMLSVSMALCQRPSLLLLDEPSEGLAPILVKSLMKTIQVFAQASSTTVILVEQNVKEALGVSERVCIMKMGDMVHEGPREDITDTRTIIEMF
jgi:branched-chain amino acid transport system ATP-binding protein